MSGGAIKVDGYIGRWYPGGDSGLILQELHPLNHLIRLIQLQDLAIHLQSQQSSDHRLYSCSSVLGSITHSDFPSLTQEHRRIGQPQDQVVQERHVSAAPLPEARQKVEGGVSPGLHQGVRAAVRDRVESAVEVDDGGGGDRADVGTRDAPDGDEQKLLIQSREKLGSQMFAFFCLKPNTMVIYPVPNWQTSAEPHLVEMDKSAEALQVTLRQEVGSFCADFPG